MMHCLVWDTRRAVSLYLLYVGLRINDWDIRITNKSDPREGIIFKPVLGFLM